jgi:septal ring factor EnvC (AmiA/AmiB activator)
VSGFGRGKDPELGTWIVRQGLTLEVEAAAAVSAVADGRVIFIGPFRSYGQVAILDHGAGFFSVYAGLDEIVKEKGSLIHSGETLARSGPRLYFEIRRGTEALDPLAWLAVSQEK